VIGEIIQSYLVSLGVQIDKPAFQQADATIKGTSATIERATGEWAANFIKASAAITAAIASVTASVAGLMKKTAQEEIEMQKYARSMMMGEDAAWSMKKAVDALGESVNDIALTPELLGRFRQLQTDGANMSVGGDFKETMKNFRDLIFEFTRLKQEASYALNWIGYYLMKYLQRPLGDIHKSFKALNDTLIRNMSVWTAKVAKGIFYIIEVGRHFLEFLANIGRALWNIWDSFPRGVKIAIAALTTLGLIVKASPIGRFIWLLGTLLLLIDDYYGYMEGKDALLGKYWDKLNEYIARAKVLWQEMSPIARELWETICEYAGKAKRYILELAHNAGIFLDTLRNNEAVILFVRTVKELGSTLWKLCKEVFVGVVEGLRSLYDAYRRKGAIKSYTLAMYKLWRVFMYLVHIVSEIVDFLRELFQELERSPEVQEFREALAELAEATYELLGVILDLIEIAFKGLFGEIEKTNTVYSFRDAIRAVVKIFTLLIKTLTFVIKLFRDLFKLMRDGKVFKKFWETLGKLIDKAIAKIGKFGRALLALVKGDFKGAWAIVSGADGGGSGNVGKGAKGIDAFMNAIMGKESGGDSNAVNSDSGASGLFQIMPENWSSWAVEAGLSADAPQTSENQRIVARHKMLEYFKEFGNWRDVAIAWYGGPGAVGYSEAAKNRKQYYNGHAYPSLNEYADAIMDSMGIPRNGIVQDDDKDDGGSGTSPNIGYTGSFDKSQWKIWSSTQGYNTPWDSKVTDISGWQQVVIDFMNDVGQALNSIGVKGTITGASEGSAYGHQSGTYSHGTGYKVDISDQEIPYGSEAFNILQSLVDSHGGKLNYERNRGHYDIVIYPQGYQPTAANGIQYSAQPLGLARRQIPQVYANDENIAALKDSIERGVITPITRALQNFQLPKPSIDTSSMLVGYRTYGGQTSASNYATSYNVNVGGVTVNGAGKDAVAIGNEVGQGVVRSFEQHVDFQTNNIGTGLLV
jgi:hypothetical protein